MSGCLLVRVGERHYALAVEHVEQIVPIGQVLAVPVACAAVRGVMRISGDLVPVVHLGAVLTHGPAPSATSYTAVLVAAAERRLALEVDEAADLLPDAPEPVPAVWEMPWAAGVTRYEGAMIPVVDVAAVIDQLELERQAVADA